MRNHPEQYLEVLKQYFAATPLIINKKQVVTNQQQVEKLFTTNQQGKMTAFQRWFSFKEAFSPAFVMAAIERLGYQPKHIIDPFGGSGTTALTAQLLDIKATTIEVNPFLFDLIKSKNTLISPEILREGSLEFSITLLETKVDLSLLAHLPPTFVESEDKHRWIYPKDVAERISQYLGAINQISNIDLKRIFRVVLGSVLVGVSNIYIDGKGRRYKPSWETTQLKPSDLDDSFNIQFNIVFNDILLFDSRPKNKVEIHNGDSRLVLKSIEQPADLIVFSPPYPNTFDYTDIYNIELWVLGYLNTSKDNSDLRRSTLRSHVQAKKSFEWPEFESLALKNIYETLDSNRVKLWNKNIPEMIVAYFKDMESILLECHRLLEPNGKVIMVVGDSKYCNVLISVAEVLEELSKAIGFTRVVSKEVRKMRVSSQQGGGRHLGEWIIELSK